MKNGDVFCMGRGNDMNIVCRLMCKEEMETAIKGGKVVKGDKGEKSYERLVGNNLSFFPIKYCDMISMGDLTTIFANMKDWYISSVINACKKRNSKVYMVVFEDNGVTDFLPQIGTRYRTKLSEPSKELLLDSYSREGLKPIIIYEIEPEAHGDRQRFELNRAPIEGYNIKPGDIVQVDSYEAAVNDMLHVLFEEEQITQIYNGFKLLRDIESAKEEMEYDECAVDDVNILRIRLYGKGGIGNWNEKNFCDAQKIMRRTVSINNITSGNARRTRTDLEKLVIRTHPKDSTRQNGKQL